MTEPAQHVLIIGCARTGSGATRANVQLECHFLHVSALQRAAGGRTACDPPLLAVADVAPWQIPRGTSPTAGPGRGTISFAAKQAGDLGPRGVGRRSARGEWVGF